MQFIVHLDGGVCYNFCQFCCCCSNSFAGQGEGQRIFQTQHYCPKVAYMAGNYSNSNDHHDRFTLNITRTSWDVGRLRHMIVTFVYGKIQFEHASLLLGASLNKCIHDLFGF